MKKHTFKPGGIHPDENKLTADYPIVRLPLPASVVLPLGQNLGAPSVPVVKAGDHVVRHQMVAEAGGFVSVPLHTPISGRVVKIDKCKTPQGMPADAIFIQSDEEDRISDAESLRAPASPRSSEEIAALSAERIKEIIREAGIVGLGGAAFPTHVKLSPPAGMTPELIIINGSECETRLTCDDAIMRACPMEIVEGTRLLMRAAGVGRGVIAIEDNKPEAIAALSDVVKDMPDIEVMTLVTKYPQGGEKQLIKAGTGREVPSGALPVSTGAIVQNVATALAVQRAVVYGEPLTDRVITLRTSDRTGNFRVSVGTIMSEVTGEISDRVRKILVGGTMMGKAAVTIDTPIVKGTSGIMFLGEEHANRPAMYPCVRCGACVDACPMGLEPYLLSTLSRLRRFEDAAEQKIANCIECGSCSWACPSGRPVLDFIRIGKAAAIAAARNRKG